MADPYNDRHTPERYEDTTDPRNPPNSVVNRQVRRTALRTYLGPLIVFFIVAGLALIYWANRSPVVNENPAEIGTSGQDVVGERGNDPDSPGGTLPEGRPGSTRDEVEYRGGAGTGTEMGGGTPLNELGSALETDDPDVVGRRIEVHDVDVIDGGDGRTFWVQDGNARIAVTGPAGTSVRTGATVDVIGVVESDAKGGVRIRATRVTP